MPTESELNAAIEAMLAAYREAVPTKPAHVAAAHLEGLGELREQLSAVLSDGAKPRADDLPVSGRLKCPAYMDRGRPIPPLYEVGDGEKRARGISPAAAVAAWNRGEFVKGV